MLVGMVLTPRYPKIRVEVRSCHPLAVVGAVRQALRKARIGHSEILRFSEQALGSGAAAADLEAICAEWVRLEVASPRAGAREPRSGSPTAG